MSDKTCHCTPSPVFRTCHCKWVHVHSRGTGAVVCRSTVWHSLCVIPVSVTNARFQDTGSIDRVASDLQTEGRHAVHFQPRLLCFRRGTHSLCSVSVTVATHYALSLSLYAMFSRYLGHQLSPLSSAS